MIDTNAKVIGEGDDVTLDNGQDNNLLDLSENGNTDFELDLESSLNLENLINEDEENPANELVVKDDVGTSNSNNSGSDTSDQETPYQILVDQFKSDEFIDESDIEAFKAEGYEFDGTKDKFYEFLEWKSYKNSQEYLQEMVSKLPEKFQKQFELFATDGLHPDRTESLVDSLDTYSKYTSDDFKDDAVAEKVVRKYLQLKDMDKDEIDEYISTHKELDNLSDKASKLNPKIVEHSQKLIEQEKINSKREDEIRQKKIEEKLENIKSSTRAFKDILAKSNFNVTDKIADKIYEARTRVIGQDANGRPLNKLTQLAQTDPEGFQNILGLVAEMGLFNVTKKGTIEPDFSKLMTLAQTKATKNIKSKVDLAASKFKSSFGSNNNTDDEDNDVLNAIKETYGN